MSFLLQMSDMFSLTWTIPKYEWTLGYRRPLWSKLQSHKFFEYTKFDKFLVFLRPLLNSISQILLLLIIIPVRSA